MSLIEYARTDRQANRMSRFLRGLPLKDYAFLGITEFFSEEWNALAGLFEWQSVPIVQKKYFINLPTGFTSCYRGRKSANCFFESRKYCAV